MTKSSKISSLKSRYSEKGWCDSISKWHWIISLLILGACFLSFHYIDMDSIVDNSFLFAQSVYKGKFFDFYKYSIENYQTSWAANYEIIVYIIFAVWNLPFVIYDAFKPLHYIDNIVCIYWSGLLILLFTAGCAFMIYKICRYMQLNKAHSLMGAYLFLSSLCVIMFTTVVAQMDIMPVFFMLLGIYYYLQDKNKQFIIAFAVAIPLKMFALFVFVPLVLLKHKNILVDIAYFIGGFSIELIQKLLFMNSLEYHYSLGSNSNSVIGNMLDKSLKLGGRDIPVFITAFIAICVYCYIKKMPENNEQKISLVLFIPTLVFSSLFLAFSTNLYWIVLLIPFVVLLIMQSGRNFQMNLLLLTATEVSYVFYAFCYSHSFEYLNSASKKTLLGKIFRVPEGYTHRYKGINDMLAKMNISNYKNAVFALFAVCLVALLIINRPRKNSSDAERSFNFQKIILWARHAVTALLILAVVYSYAAVYPKLSFNTTGSGAHSANQCDIMNGGVVTQPVKFERDSTITSIIIRLDNKAASRKNMGTVKVELCERGGNAVFSASQGTSMIKSKKDFELKVPKLKVSKDKYYELVVTGKTDKMKKSVYPMLTNEKKIDDSVAFDGIEQNGNLYVKIR